MNNKILQLIDQISALEEELNAAIQQREERLRYKLEGKRVVFEQTLKDAHHKVKVGVFRWIRTVRPQNFFTAPFIYGMIFPIIFFDLCVSLYQLICFPIYRIAKVKRTDYIVIDHQHLAYLNLFEKIHCVYCSYAVGLLGYANEITARTEQYFCPIKHAHKVLATHSRYKHFLAYGEAENLHEKIEILRSDLEKEIEQEKP